MKPKNRVVGAAVLSSILIMIPQSLWAQNQDESNALEEVVVVGSRSAEGRTALETPVAVDVFGIDELSKTGRLELNQALAATVPSFNFNQTAINDGTDIVRPATLRGLAPDQVLVLLNGKRRHSSALVNINGSVGRGSAAVDLNAIPATAIEAVEVLRDGAAAQYGSDAIAGVINVRLKKNASGGGVNAFFGKYNTDVDVAERSASDGDTLSVGFWQGFNLGGDGFLTLAAEYKDREPSNRAGLDPRQQYPELADGSPDPREATFDRLNHRYGNGNAEDINVFINAGIPLSDTTELYGFAGYQDREADSPGFYRRAGDATRGFRSTPRNLTEIYPDGFLPVINGDVSDFSLGGGVRGEWGSWNYDASLVHGTNELDYTVRSTLNASLGPNSQTEFDAGGLEYDQTLLNLDITQTFDDLMPGQTTLSFGAEYRDEGFGIREGEPNSYIQGGYRGVLGVNFTAEQDPEGDGVGFAAGSQVFGGFTPQSAVNASRDSFSLYADVEWQPIDQFLLGVAVRFEDYSDFGSETIGKVTARYDFNQQFALRGAVSTGFRAPSLQQQFFTATSTNFIDGVPFEIGTFPASSAPARALGGEDLGAETSDNLSLGFVWRPSDNFYLTADAYRIDIDDQIFLSENLGGGAVNDALTSAGVNGVQRVRFFQNGLKTETSGFDLVARYDMDTRDWGAFSATAGFNYSDTEVTFVPTNRVVPDLTLFSRDRTLTVEESAPETKLVLSLNWALSKMDFNTRVTRYGDVLDPSNNPDNDFTLDAETIVDFSFNYPIGDRFDVGIGMDNVFDEYPTATPSNQSFNGIFPYSSRSPFGFAGRFWYLRGSVNW